MRERDLQFGSISDLLGMAKEELATAGTSSANVQNCANNEESIADALDELNNAMSNVSTIIENLEKKLQKVSEEIG